MSLVKYRLREVAADFGVTPKEITEIVGTYFEKPKSNTQVLTEEELNVVFQSFITQKGPSKKYQISLTCSHSSTAKEPSFLK